MSRLPDWPKRLHAYIVETRALPFEWGTHDCALFAAGAVEAVTGEDPAAKWRGQYTTEAEGMALIRAAGFADHIAAARHERHSCPVLKAQKGDLAILDSPDGQALGVVVGGVIAVLTPRGMGSVLLETAAETLMVGRCQH